MKNKKPTWLKKGVYTGMRDRFGNEIKLGDYVKITIGKPNNGYEVVYDPGAFCFTGPQVGLCSFIKFRDELITGQITGESITESFQNFLEVVLKPVSQPLPSTTFVPVGTASINWDELAKGLKGGKKR